MWHCFTTIFFAGSWLARTNDRELEVDIKLSYSKPTITETAEERITLLNAARFFPQGDARMHAYANHFVFKQAGISGLKIVTA